MRLLISRIIFFIWIIYSATLFAANADPYANLPYEPASINQAIDNFKQWFEISGKNLADLESIAIEKRKSFHDKLEKCIPGTYQYPIPNMNYMTAATPIYYLVETKIYGYDNQLCVTSDTDNAESKFKNICELSAGSISAIVGPEENTRLTLLAINKKLNNVVQAMLANDTIGFYSQLAGMGSPSLASIHETECKEIKNDDKTNSLASITDAFATSPYNRDNLKNRDNYMDFAAKLGPLIKAYQSGVFGCFSNPGGFKGCDGGTHRIPPNIVSPNRAVASAIVKDGVITIMPIEAKGILASDVVIYNPVAKQENVMVISFDLSGAGARKYTLGSQYLADVKYYHPPMYHTEP
jgi:hypothetical protein